MQVLRRGRARAGSRFMHLQLVGKHDSNIPCSPFVPIRLVTKVLEPARIRPAMSMAPISLLWFHKPYKRRTMVTVYETVRNVEIVVRHDSTLGNHKENGENHAKGP